MKNYLLLPLLLLVFACKPSAQNSPSVEHVSPTEFKAKLAAAPNAQLVDVRTPEEVSKGALPNALNIDFYETDFKDKISKLDKSKPVFVYCAKGGRSSQACNIFGELGFKQVIDMKGGYTAWKELGL